MNRFRKRLRGEILESRFCLSSVTFVEREFLARGGSPTVSIELADLDGDDDLDMILGRERSNGGVGEVSWIEKLDGLHRYAEERLIAAVPPDESFQVVDLDDDADLDIVLLQSAAWYENIAGNASEWRMRDLPIFKGSHGVILDADDDSDLDLLTTHYWNNCRCAAILITEGAGSGIFGETRLFSATNVSGLQLVDVDNDGDKDVIAVLSQPNTDDSIVWFEKFDGRVSAEPSLLLRISHSLGNLASMEPVDFEGDGDVDLVLGFESLIGEHIRVAEAQPNGELLLSEMLAAVPFGYLTARASDVDGDGDHDVLFGTGGGLLKWLENKSPAGLFDSVDFDGTREVGGEVLASVRGTIQSMVVRDADHDGDEDVFAAFRFGDVSVLRIRNRLIGDSNDDGIFNSSDLVAVFTTGKYEDVILNNATFDEGDWNQDGLFNSSDLVYAFQAGNYVFGAQPFATEIASAVDGIFDQDGVEKKSRAFVA